MPSDNDKGLPVSYAISDGWAAAFSTLQGLFTAATDILKCGRKRSLDTTALDHSVIEGELKEICNEEVPPAI